MTARSRSKFIDAAIADYAIEHSSGPDEIQLELQRVTAERTGIKAGIQVGDDQAGGRNSPRQPKHQARSASRGHLVLALLMKRRTRFRSRG